MKISNCTRALLTVVCALAGLSTPAFAEVNATYELGIVATNCERTPTSFPFQGGDCVPAEGVVIVITTSDGALVGTCITSADSRDDLTANCSVAVPLGSSLIVTEDTATIPPGYAPAHNPQELDMPSSPPDGVFGGPVFLNLPTETEPEATSEIVRTVRSVPELIGDPDWWIVPQTEGWGNTEEGRLYFSSRIHNPTAKTVSVGVSFSAYEADGTPFPGCQQPLGDGPGVTTTIAPGETAILRCFRTIVPNTLEGLQVTARLWLGDSIQTTKATVAVTDIQLLSLPEYSSPMENTYDATALVSTAGRQDTEVELVFRFYDPNGDQVAVCESGSVRIEPEVDRRVSCDWPLMLDSVGSQPTTVRVEATTLRD